MALAGPSHLLSSSSSCLRRLNPLLFSAHRRPPWTARRDARRFCAAVASERDVFTSPEVAKSFDFTNEERIYKWWESQGFFKPNFDRGGDPFVIPMPPANVTGSLHMGHAMFVTLEDIMIRYFRMKGRPALWIPGTDHAGIATQLVVEKMLAAKGVKRTDLTREEFTERVWEWKEKKLKKSLLHPFMPFVTEELWQALPYRKHALIVAPWPSTDLPKNLLSIKRFQNLQSLIRGIRNVRAEYSVEPAKRISASVVASADVLEYISKEKQVLALLSKLDAQNVHFTESLPSDANQSVHIVADEGLEAYLPLADMVDVSEEVKRLSKRLSKMQTEYNALLARLSSPSFVEKAPEDIVRGVREKASEAEEKISLTKNRLSFLQSTVSA